MKKNYLLVLLLFIATLSYGQVRVLEDFDVSMTPTGWTNSLNAGTLISRQTTVNSYGRAGVVAAVRANNYNVASGNRARLETNLFTSSVSGDSLSLDVAHRAYPAYTDSLIIHTFNGTSFVRLIGWGSSQLLDTITGITTGTPTTGSFTPTSTQWCRKTIALPIGTTQIRFEFFSNFGNAIWIDNIVIATPNAPVGLITGTKSNLTSSSVTLAATIPVSFPSVTNSGVVIGTGPGPVKGSAIDSASNPLVANGSFTVDVTGLSTATTYYYRSYAVNAIGITYGPDSTFTTNASAVLASINRNIATNVQTTTATIGGTIINNGGDPITMSGVVYSTTPMPAKYTSAIDSVTTPNVTLGTFSINPTGLTHSTKYYYRAYAINSVGVAYSAQDSFTTSPIVSVLPYSQNFDGVGNTGWTSVATGGINEWLVGTPAKTQLSGAFSGTKCWFTSTAANYVDNSNAAVVSPQFDFTALTVDPVVRFRHNFKTESGWDAAVLEISINGGVWTQLDNTLGTGANFNTVNSISWYNSSSTSGPIAPSKWSENSNLFATKVGNWIQSTTKLTGAAGQGNVRFRLRFGSDASGTDEGWAFDDVEVFPPTAPTMATGTKTNLTNNSVTLAGTIVSNGNSAVTASGVVIGTGPGPVRGSAIDSATNPLVANGSFTVNVTGLSAATTYYYRSYAVNGVNTSYGPDSTFTTNASAVLASVNRNIATNVQATTATIGGTIINNGGDPITISGVVYDTLSLPTRFSSAVDSATTPNIASGTFSFNISGLVHSKKYYYRAYAVNSVGTAYSTQDSFTTPPVISTFPYSQNFDGAGNTGWTSSAIGGGVNDWQLGTPAKTNISAAYSAPNAWVTKLTGNYSNNSYSGLVSPQFNFTTMTADPVLRFRHKFRFVQTAIDGAIVEISINGGAWTQLDNTVGTGANFNTTNSTSWYSANTTFWNSLTGAMFANNSTSYATQSNGWIQSTVRLTGAAGQSNVKVRMTFNSTTFTFFGVEEGWAIDDIEVFPPTAPTMATGTKTNLTNNSVTLAGTIVSNGNSPVTASGVVIGTGPGPVRGSAIDSATNPLVANGSFTVNVASLSTSTTYYYRSYAINAIGTSYGPDSTFTTNASATLASINRNVATNVQTTTATIGGTIINNGGDPVTMSGVVYDINPMPVKYTSAIDSVTTPNVALGTFNINPAGLTHSTKYYYRAYAINSVGIAYSAQDSFTTAPIISTLPYAENFDGATTPWTTQAINSRVNSWTRGTPAKTVINAAYSAPNAFVTNLTANYGLTGDEEAALVSPQFNFTALTQDPVLRFRHKIKTSNDPGWDAGNVEISLNGGTTWTKLNDQTGTTANFNTLTSYAWYNSTSGSGYLTANKFTNLTSAYVSQTSGWIESATRLTGAAGQPNVKVRFHFAADAAGIDEGWAIDDIQVVSDVTPTIPTGTVTLTPNGTSVNVAFVPGNGQGRLVVARLTSATAVAPYDTVLYTANAVYGSGTLVGAGNYVVYNGTGSSVNVTGLTTVTGYSFDVYEYNGRYMHNKFAAASTNATTTLPVKLLSFTANNVEGNVQLKWVTANEINNKGFEIERSTDGKNFKSIDFVKGAGNTNKTSKYSKIDLGAFIATSSNVLYYRLKQVDFDGTPTYSNQVVVNENELVSNGVKVYPNPFTKTLTVDIASDANTNTTIAITDISGKVISTTLVPVSVGNNTTTLPNLDLLTAGIYFVKVLNGTKAEVFKVIKY